MKYFFVKCKAGFLLIETCIASCMMGTIIICSFYYYWQMRMYASHTKRYIDIVYDIYDCSTKKDLYEGEKSIKTTLKTYKKVLPKETIDNIDFIPIKQVYHYTIGNKIHTIYFVMAFGF